MINKDGNEDFKKYVLYTKGKVFDENIGKYKKEVNTINKLSNLLEQKDGATADENNARKALSDALGNYVTSKEKCEELIQNCKKLGVDYKQNTEYVKQKNNFDKSKLKLEAKFESLKNMLPYLEQVDYKDFLRIIEQLKTIEGKDVKESIKEGLENQSKTARRNVENNMKAVEGIIREGKEMEVNFKGFSNYNNNLKTRAPILPAAPRKSLLDIIRHPIKSLKKWRETKELQEQIVARRVLEAGYENYDESAYNFDDIKAVKVVKEFISRDTKAKLNEIEDLRRAEEARSADDIEL